MYVDCSDEMTLMLPVYLFIVYYGDLITPRAIYVYHVDEWNTQLRITYACDVRLICLHLTVLYVTYHS